MFSLDWFVDCCSVADKDGRVKLVLKEGVQSAYLRRLMERVEEKDWRKGAARRRFLVLNSRKSA